MPTDDHDDLFDAWGAALNVNPQLGKTVFHLESSGGKNVGPSLRDDPDSPIGPMQMRPSTARRMAEVMGLDPKAADPRDIRWAVPLGMAYLAEGLTKTRGEGEAALGYYYSGSADPNAWGPKTRAYIDKGRQLYPTMTLRPPPAPAAVAAADPEK